MLQVASSGRALHSFVVECDKGNPYPILMSKKSYPVAFVSINL